MRVLLRRCCWGCRFRLLAVSEYARELEQAIETTAAEVFCPSCGALARLHNRRPVWVRDLPVAGRPTVLVCEVGMALPRAGLREEHVDRDE